jgi:3-methyladenine DNA glycosylase AlkD
VGYTLNMTETVETVLARLKALANPEHRAGMLRYGINPRGTLGISIYTLRDLAKEIGPDHELAQGLWDSGFHEARILASYLEKPEWVTEEQMERWVQDFDSWDTCDQVSGLFEATPYAYLKAIDWSSRPEEFVKRAAFAIMAGLAVHDKLATDEQFIPFFPVIARESIDERNFVKKAVNWALRNLGKRNRNLNEIAIHTAKEIQKYPSKAARWVAADALRELTGDKVQGKLKV